MNTDMFEIMAFDRDQAKAMTIPEQADELDEVIGKLSAAALQSSPNDDQIIADHVRDSVALLLKYRHKVRERASLMGVEQMREALTHARGAIASLETDALGGHEPSHPEDEGYSYRDALLAEIDAALLAEEQTGAKP